MAFTKYTTSTANIAGLGDKPNTDDGLTPAQLKGKFDKGSADIATYLNSILTAEIDSDLATKAELAAVVVAGLSPDSITNTYLATDVKVGSLAALTTPVKTSVTAAINSVNPIGSIITWVTSTAPTGYLECNGAAINRTTYAGLFTVIGTTFGVGDNSTTFNLPELRGEFIRGWDNSRGIDVGRTLGSSQAQQVNLEDTSQPWYGGSATSTPQFNANELRPRNIALMYCIKY